MTEDEFIKNLPAFPHEHRVGMTLRDYFAAQALAGICANQDNRVYGNAMEFARAAYRLADAMLTARGQG